MIHKFCESHKDDDSMGQFVRPLAKLNKEWGDLTSRIGMQATQDPENVGQQPLIICTTVAGTLAYLWARMAVAAQQHINNGSDDAFYKAKLKPLSSIRNCCHAPKFMLSHRLRL